ncbi:MAG: CsgG/HfaB family protein [Patescibacteria group bacterium]
MKYFKILLVLLITIVFAGCVETKTELGQGGSMATGSSSNAGPKGETKELARCPKAIATVEIDEPLSGVTDATAMPYAYVAQMYGVPQDPLPLLKLMFAQTGCFQVVDRAAGLRAAKREHELVEAGYTRKGNTLDKGNVVEAQFTITPHIIFFENNASGDAIMAGAIFDLFVPGIGGLIAKSSMVKEAQVLLTLINNETLIQEGVAEGSARSTDTNIGGGAIGVFGGAGGGVGAGSWNNTNNGKVVAAALLDATNKIVSMVQNLNVPQVSQPVTQK